VDRTVAFDRQTGAIRWTAPFGGGTPFNGQVPAVAGGLVVAGGRAAATGRRRRARARRRPVRRPARAGRVDRGRALVVRRGRRLRRVPDATRGPRSPGDVVVVDTLDVLTGFALGDGSVLWRRPNPTTLSAEAPGSGLLLWSDPLVNLYDDGFEWSDARPVVANGTLFAALQTTYDDDLVAYQIGG
jgi:outer membrane protein assembly factor BamB